MLGRLLLIVFLCALIGAAALVLPLWRELPPARPVKAELAALSAQRGAEWVALDRVPRALQEAMVATEDARFYEHRGLDVLGTARASLANVREGRWCREAARSASSSANAISSAKTGPSSGSCWWWEWRFKLEAAYNKQDILEMYLNSVYFGPYAYGIGSAARVYFGKPVEALTLAESTLLAGLPQAHRSTTQSKGWSASKPGRRSSSPR